MIAEPETREESSISLDERHSNENLMNYRLNLCF